MGGKSLGDVLDGILRHLKLFLAANFLVACIGLQVVAGCLLLAKLLGLRVDRIDISPSGPTVIVREAGAGVEQRLAVVSPNGWEAVGVPLRPGDEVTFSSGGRVNVDLPGLIEDVQRRLARENALVARHRLNRHSVDPKDAPEYVRAADRETTGVAPSIAREWNGPDGILELAPAPRAFAARVARRVIPGAPLGALLAAIVPEGQPLPRREDAFLVGANNRGAALRVTTSGYLYFIVNDVLDDARSQATNNTLFNDNLGFFVVSITIRRAD